MNLRKACLRSWIPRGEALGSYKPKSQSFGHKSRRTTPPGQRPPDDTLRCGRDIGRRGEACQASSPEIPDPPVDLENHPPGSGKNRPPPKGMSRCGAHPAAASCGPAGPSQPGPPPPYFGCTCGLPPGAPGGGITGVRPASGVGALISGSTAAGGQITPPDWASLLLKV